MAELGIYSWIIACLLIYLPWHYGRVIAIIFPIMGIKINKKKGFKTKKKRDEKKR
jgi:hypothetical protein